MHRRNLAKILGLALLAAVGVMAVSASAAQAGWLLLKNGSSVELLQLKVKGLLGELSVPGIGLGIHCEKATGNATLHSTGTGSASVKFQECTVLGDEQCTVLAEEEGGSGEIWASAEGVLGMNGEEEVYVKAEGEPFTGFFFSGVFCTLPEEVEVKGLALLTLLKALLSEAEHLVHVDEGLDNEGKTELFYGKEPAYILGELETPGGKKKGAALAHVTEISGATWAVHLTE